MASPPSEVDVAVAEHLINNPLLPDRTVLECLEGMGVLAHRHDPAVVKPAVHARLLLRELRPMVDRPDLATLEKLNQLVDVVSHAGVTDPSCLSQLPALEVQLRTAMVLADVLPAVGDQTPAGELLGDVRMQLAARIDHCLPTTRHDLVERRERLLLALHSWDALLQACAEFPAKDVISSLNTILMTAKASLQEAAKPQLQAVYERAAAIPQSLMHLEGPALEAALLDASGGKSAAKRRKKAKQAADGSGVAGQEGEAGGDPGAMLEGGLPAAAMSGGTGGKDRRRVGRWSEIETQTLVELVQKYGKGRWKEILAEGQCRYGTCGEQVFNSRTQVDLKDKWRNLLKQKVVMEDGRWAEQRTDHFNSMPGPGLMYSPPKGHPLMPTDATMTPANPQGVGNPDATPGGAPPPPADGASIDASMASAPAAVGVAGGHEATADTTAMAAHDAATAAGMAPPNVNVMPMPVPGQAMSAEQAAVVAAAAQGMVAGMPHMVVAQPVPDAAQGAPMEEVHGGGNMEMGQRQEVHGANMEMGPAAAAGVPAVAASAAPAAAPAEAGNEQNAIQV